jgi:hypothetical protein
MLPELSAPLPSRPMAMRLPFELGQELDRLRRAVENLHQSHVDREARIAQPLEVVERALRGFDAGGPRAPAYGRAAP